MADSDELNRRDFVKIAVASIGTIISACIGVPAIAYLVSPATKAQAQDAWIPLGPLEKFPVGTPTLVNFTRTTVNGWEKTANSYGAYVIRYTPDELKVFSNLCTHLSCRVNWNSDQQIYICPCHDGHFDSQGKVVAGPPPSPLDEYEHKVDNGILFIHFVEM
jgi:quinol---cytochrome c reductase iron-sulfur subunit, bacillus type